MLRQLQLTFLFAHLCLTHCETAFIALKPWPSTYSVKFNATIVSFNAIDLPSELHYDWEHKTQVVRHYQCPAPFLHASRCRVVFTTDVGTHVVEDLPILGKWVTLPTCCKLFDYGPVPPYLFSANAVQNGSDIPCPEHTFLGTGRKCNSYDLFGHAMYLIDVETQLPVKFQAIFPEPAGLVSWTYTEAFRPLDTVQIEKDKLCTVPPICLPKCPLADLGQ